MVRGSIYPELKDTAQCLRLMVRTEEAVFSLVYFRALVNFHLLQQPSYLPVLKLPALKSPVRESPTYDDSWMEYQGRGVQEAACILTWWNSNTGTSHTTALSQLKLFLLLSWKLWATPLASDVCQVKHLWSSWIRGPHSYVELFLSIGPWWKKKLQCRVPLVSSVVCLGIPQLSNI